jgi:hypothetical protein
MTANSDMTTLVSAADLDEVLSSYRPFGDSGYIYEQMHASYCRRLHVIAKSLPSAGRLAGALSGIDSHLSQCVLGDTAVRCATQHAYRQVQTDAPYGLPLQTCDEVFARTADLIHGGILCGPLESTVTPTQHIGSTRPYGWVWTEDHPDDVFGKTFRELIRQNYGESLSSPRDTDIAMIREAVSLLEELLPNLAENTLPHTHVVALFDPVGNWAGRASGSQFRLGGTIFLNREVMHNPWWVAEHLLHESLHQKLYDFRHAHSLLAQDLLPLEEQLALETDDPSKRSTAILSPWNTPGMTELNMWDTHRALAAFHVYVHLSLLCGEAYRRASSLGRRFGPLHEQPPTMTDPRIAMNRAQYLGENLNTTCRGELGLAGQMLVEWLSSVLAALDSAPPPANSFVHLLLDRYLLEAKAVERTDLNIKQGRVIEDLCRREIANAGEVLIALDVIPAINNFNTAIEQMHVGAAKAAFSSTRQLIVRTLLAATTDGYTFRNGDTSSQEIDYMVRDMVENSSSLLAKAGLVG